MASEHTLPPVEPADPNILPDEADVSRETEQDEVADRARKLGHKSKEEFVAAGGKEDAWTSPAEFIRVKERLREERSKENKKLERALEARDRLLQEQAGRLEKLEKALSDQQTARGEIQESALWSQRRAALEQQDWDEVNRIDKQLRDVRAAPQQEPPPQRQAAPDPRIKAIFDEFVEDNPVYHDNPKMQSLLARGAQIAAASDPDLKGRELLEEAHDTARRLWSDRYTTTGKRNGTAMAETSGTPSRASSSEKGWNDLKPEARDALNALIKDSPTYAKMKPAEIDAARKRMVSNSPPEHFKGR